MNDNDYFKTLRLVLKIPDAETRKAKLQELYCIDSGLPQFAPESGLCGFCGCNIYKGNRISEEEAATRLITGCKRCGHSFCD